MYFPQSIFEPMYITIYDSKKALLVCIVNLSVWQFVNSFVVFGNILQAKRGKKGVKMSEI